MAKRGRPRKMTQLELPTLEKSYEEKKQSILNGLREMEDSEIYTQGENVMADERKLKIMTRGINKQSTFGIEGDKPAQIVEDDVNAYLLDGYELKEVYMIGNTPDLINLMFVLVKP